jgi:ATP-binding cassette subfamily B protein
MRRRLRVVRHVLRLSVRADPGAAVLVCVIVVLQAASAALLALAQRQVVDAAALGITGAVVVAALLGALAHATVATGNRIQNNLRIDLAERVDLTLTREVLTLASRTPTIEHLERPDYLNRLTALRAGTRDLAASCWSILETAASLLSLGASLWLLTSVHPALACLAVLGVPPLLFARGGQRLVRHAMDACAEEVRHEQHLHDLCTRPEPAKEVRVAGNGAELSRRADRLWQDTARHEIRARVLGLLWELAGWACYASGFAVAIIVVTSLVGHSEVTLGAIIMVITLATALRAQIALTVAGIGQLGTAGHVTGHYLWLVDHAATQHRGAAPAPARLTEGIRLTGVGFRYPGASADALRDISLWLPAGATVGLVGINGAGKSSLIKLLVGLYEPSRGEITIDGHPLRLMDPDAWSSRLSGAFQDFVMLQSWCHDSVGAGDLARLNDEPGVRAAVSAAGADDTVATLPDGLRTRLGLAFDGVELAHGQWQRLALARAMMRHGPLLVVLDEPTAALDPQAEHDIFERFRALAGTASERGAITILVSHRFSTVRLTDHIVVLDDGRVMEQGSHDELIAADGGYARLYRTQAEGYR